MYICRAFSGIAFPLAALPPPPPFNGFGRPIIDWARRCHWNSHTSSAAVVVAAETGLKPKFQVDLKEIQDQTFKKLKKN
jgi:hypothetical protein